MKQEAHPNLSLVIDEMRSGHVARKGCGMAHISILFHVFSSFDYTNDIVALREICHPIVQSLLFFLVKILPVGSYVFGFGGG